jgi:hypothetical protein
VICGPAVFRRHVSRNPSLCGSEIQRRAAVGRQSLAGPQASVRGEDRLPPGLRGRRRLIWSCGSPSCGQGSFFRRCWSGAAAWISRCRRSSWRPTCNSTHSTSTRRVDDLVKALGADTRIAKSEASPICADWDTEVAAFRDRSLAGIAFPHASLDAAYCMARVDRVVPAGRGRLRVGSRRAPGGAGLRCRRQRRRRVLEPRSCDRSAPAAWPGWRWSFREAAEVRVRRLRPCGATTPLASRECPLASRAWLGHLTPSRGAAIIPLSVKFIRINPIVKINWNDWQ